MICKPCARAADAVSEAFRRRRLPTAATWRKAARLHGQCRGGTWCDCQHRDIGGHEERGDG